MRLRNSLRHMVNNKIRVNGVSYSLDGKGVISITDEKAITTLLQDDAWSKISERTPVGVPTKAVDKVDFSEMAKPDLINLCRYKKLNFKSSMKKEELIALLEKE